MFRRARESNLSSQLLDLRALAQIVSGAEDPHILRRKPSSSL